MFGRCFGYYDFFLFINLPSTRPYHKGDSPEVEGVADSLDWIFCLPVNQEKIAKLTKIQIYQNSIPFP